MNSLGRAWENETQTSITNPCLVLVPNVRTLTSIKWSYANASGTWSFKLKHFRACFGLTWVNVDKKWSATHLFENRKVCKGGGVVRLWNPSISRCRFILHRPTCINWSALWLLRMVRVHTVEGFGTHPSSVSGNASGSRLQRLWPAHYRALFIKAKRIDFTRVTVWHDSATWKHGKPSAPSKDKIIEGHVMCFLTALAGAEQWPGSYRLVFANN